MYFLSIYIFYFIVAFIYVQQNIYMNWDYIQIIIHKCGNVGFKSIIKNYDDKIAFSLKIFQNQIKFLRKGINKIHQKSFVFFFWKNSPANVNSFNGHILDKIFFLWFFRNDVMNVYSFIIRGGVLFSEWLTVLYDLRFVFVC